MSDRIDYSEYVLARRRLTEARCPAGRRELQNWLADFKDAFVGVPYLTIGRSQIGDDSNALIEIRGSIKMPCGEPEYVRRDFENIFQKDLAPGTRGSHAFSMAGNAFSFMFCCVTRNNDYVTGRLRAAFSR